MARIGIIGMGWVGSSVAISTLHSGIANELLLNDVRTGIAEGEAMDMAHGAPFYPSATVRTATVEEMADADAVVIAAGRGGRPGESRLDLLKENATIVRNLGAQLTSCRGVIILVSNPVDVLTQVMTEASGLPPERVIGTGTMLDTARLRQMLGAKLRLDSRSIHAQVLGEHGDSSVCLWSSARIGGTSLLQLPAWRREWEETLSRDVKRAAQEIIQRKGATNHAIGLVTAALLRWMLRGERRVVTVSRVQNGALGFRDVAFSMPTVVGRDGAVEIIEPSLSREEAEHLAQSATILSNAKAAIED